MTPSTRLMFVLPVAVLVACGDKDPVDSGDSGVSAVDCSTEARSSAQVTVQDGAGADLSSVATVTYTVDGETFPCNSYPDGQFVCGYEVAGTLTITATADGYEDAQLDVVVEEDECHVITEMVTMTMVDLASE